jgi:NAD(P)H-hydrate epimerase
MLPVFTAAEMRALDARAIGELGIPGATLMEHAGAGAARLLAREFAPIRGRRVVLVAGGGNNGGDAFVAARHLRARGARVRLLLAGRRAELRGDAARAAARWRGPVAELGERPDPAAVDRALGGAEVIVDGLLGTGLAGPAREPAAGLIEAINRAGRPVLALDLPSGLPSDTGGLPGPAVRATLTATFAGWKRSLLLHPAAACAGRVAVIPIGIPPEEVGRGIRTHLLEESDLRAALPPRRADAHKGAFGHLLIVAGSRGKTGAAALAGLAALRSGVGLCTIATACSQQPVVAGLGLEFMTEALPETAAGSPAAGARARVLELAERADAVALGPGLGLEPETQALARALVAELPRPMVVDADALTALAGHLDLLARAPAPRLLTPHPGEMARLLGTGVPAVQEDRIETTRAFCRAHRVHLVLKGAGSVVGDPEGRILINPTGNPGMAKGGSGDVLTGMAGAFLARGLAPGRALATATFLHGRAGDVAAAAQGQESLLATDVIAAIGPAFRSLDRP